MNAALVSEKIIEGPRALRGGRTRAGVGRQRWRQPFPADGENASVLIRNADTAMYRAKERGGNIVHFYTPALTKAVQQRVSIESALRRAMDANELELTSSPSEIDSRRIVGIEALLHAGREEACSCPRASCRSPSCLVSSFRSAVINLVCAHLAGWRTQSLRVLRLSINVSGLSHAWMKAFLVVLEQALARYQVPAGAIDLEITESCFLDRGRSTDSADAQASSA